MSPAPPRPRRSSHPSRPVRAPRAGSVARPASPAAPASLPAAGGRPRGAARREALLEAVLRIVAEVGADAVTHRRVAEAAQLPLASTTYWFDSKEHLLTAALEMAAERDVARLHDYARAVEAAPAVDPLDAAAVAITDPLDEDLTTSRGSLTATYALLLEAARRPALRAIAARWTEAYIDTLSALLKRAGSARPRDDAQLLLATADGLLIEQLASGSGGDLRPRLRRLAAALVQMR